jgi:hypothetical protein
MTLFKALLHWHVQFGFQTSNFLFKKSWNQKQKFFFKKEKGQHTPHTKQILLDKMCHSATQKKKKTLRCHLFLDFFNFVISTLKKKKLYC